MHFVRKVASGSFGALKRIYQKGLKNKTVFCFNGTDIDSYPLTFSGSNDCGMINGTQIKKGYTLHKDSIYPWENVVDKNGRDSIRRNIAIHAKPRKQTVFDRLDRSSAIKKWNIFVEQAIIPSGWKNAGFYYACFDLSTNAWSAPDWFWTNSALVPHFIRIGRFDLAKNLSEKLLSNQLPNGGWIVRSGFDSNGAYEIIGPNDSAYLCDHGLLAWFEHSGDEQYLKASMRCANWIMHEASSNYIPFFGWNIRDNKIMDYANIVDIGFTAGLFCHLYRLLKTEEYLDFAKEFLLAYTKLFYLGKGRFNAAVDKEGKHRGTGLFMRGQAWALEGLLPFCELVDSPELKTIACDTVRNILKLQRASGSWLHIWRPGIMQLVSDDDSKGTPVIAAALNRSKKIMPKSEHTALDQAVNKAIDWCVRHTASDGAGEGGVFSWNPEGSFGLNNNVSAACVYSNAYLSRLISEKTLS